MYKFKGKNLIIIALIITMSFIINGCTKKAPEGVIATVNKENITEEEFEKEYEIQANTMENRLGKGVLDQVGTDGKLVEESLREEILNIFILEKLILQDADKKDITVNDDEINKKIKEIEENMGGVEKLKEYQEDVDMDDKYFKMFVKKDILLEKHKANYIEELELEDEEIESFFEENKENLTLVKARQILVEKQDKGEELLKQLKNGADFESLATENSIDADTALKGGELGYFPKGSNPEEFDEVVFGLNEGEISPLIETEKGYHIVEIQDVKNTFESLKDEVTHFANENKYVEYLEGLQDDAKIETYLDVNDKNNKEDEE
ncbi:MAG: peptidylprolyl isomerase [Tissierella sp.]|uniref:peptidylprolyl isomerase n=1 Tax=Tissierella sp. TaxID=41274 RepID=UPI003F9AC049